CAFTSRSAYTVLSHGSFKEQNTLKTAVRTGGLLCPDMIRTNGRVGGSWVKNNRRRDRRLRSRTKDAARIGLLGVSVTGHGRRLIILALQLCLRLLSRLSRI
ncbi:hypothetical protein MUK42_33023, partial [Musa troglodytarum]